MSATMEVIMSNIVDINYRKKSAYERLLSIAEKAKDENKYASIIVVACDVSGAYIDYEFVTDHGIMHLVGMLEAAKTELFRDTEE